ncbi:MAG: hypothetical protein HY678_12095 [Chloroflexi bacterium]|nr:hypothetical protein [Chloroflexota bacterium]
MATSTALDDFRQRLRIARALLDLETSTFPDPPKPHDLAAVLGLRGGAAVLMVGAYERFLTECVQEQVRRIAERQPPAAFARLPHQLQISTIWGTLRAAMGEGAKKDVDRIPAIKVASAKVLKDTVSAEVFGVLNGLTGTAAMKKVADEIGLSYPFSNRTFKESFWSLWGKEEANTFIENKVDEIVRRRHVVAHRADALHVSRKDIADGIEFMDKLVTAINGTLVHHFDRLVR